MKISRVHSTHKLAAQLALLGLPTVVFAAFLLLRLNTFNSILQNDWIKQTVYFGTGLVVSLLLYAWRFRFITTMAVVAIVNYFLYNILGSISQGEFDAFYFSVQFLIFSILFGLGWLTGYGLSRSRVFTIGWSVLLLVLEIIIISRSTEITAYGIIRSFAPAIAYSFYIIYTAELLRSMNEKQPKFIWFLVKRFSAFVVILLLMFFMLFGVFKKEFTALETDWGGAQSKEGQGGGKNESMTSKDRNGGVRNKDQTRLTGSLSKDRQLIFIAKLDNFFDDGRTPNPLYFTSHYYTKFDTSTQTFEVDKNMPYNDLYQPDPSKIPLYFTAVDSNVIRRSLGTLKRKVVSAEIYKAALASSEYLAPSTAFYCQPISVPKEFKDQYRSAYRAKMWVSDLNSAYFIYNPAGNRILEGFQEQRFELLRQITSIRGPSPSFMKYYTYMPAGEDYRKIGALAKQVTEGAATPIDRIIAIRDYFLSKNENGQPLFAYSDNPGIPGMPSANKLSYFLLENRKGYCAYFAGATLFMLRSLGIPSRVAAGFLTEDRSSKNPGWYWFYQNQAHAWVQVYFQGYGWIDFDTTIPDLSTHESPQPDGTPPSEVPQIYLVADGKVVAVDTVRRTIRMSVDKMLFIDKDYKGEALMTADVSVAHIHSDTGDVRLGLLEKGARITAVSHSETLKDIPAEADDTPASIVKKLPSPVPVDEIKVMLSEKETQKAAEKKNVASEARGWKRILMTAALILLSLVLLFFLSPTLIWQWYHSRARSEDGGGYYRYRAALYYLNQLGYAVDPMQAGSYAHDTDRALGTRLEDFSGIYQRIKYSSIAPNETEMRRFDSFYPEFIRQVRSRIPPSERMKRFLEPVRTIRYFKKIKNR